MLDIQEKLLRSLGLAQELEKQGKLREALYEYAGAYESLRKIAGDLKSPYARDRAAHADALGGKIRRLRDRLGMPDEKPEPPRAGALPQMKELDGPASRFVTAEKPATKLCDVVGLEKVKRALNNKLIVPMKFPEKAKRFGIRVGGGILLYGPPGNGKTLIARAVAGEVDAAFFTVKPSEIMSKWVGEAEQNVDRLFKAAKEHSRAIIFIDEIESMVPKRAATSSSVMPRVITQFLAELEGFEERTNALLFLGATNEPWMIDPAMLRPGRFDEKIYIPLPDARGRAAIFQVNLKDRPVDGAVDCGRLGEVTGGYSGADIRGVCEKASWYPLERSIRDDTDSVITMDDLTAALADTKPSVDRAQVERFERFTFSQ